MADFERPIDAAYKALPGTLQELAARTGYPPSVVVDLIHRLRSEGTVVACTMGEHTPEGWEPSSYLIRSTEGDTA